MDDAVDILELEANARRVLAETCHRHRDSLYDYSDHAKNAPACPVCARHVEWFWPRSAGLGLRGDEPVLGQRVRRFYTKLVNLDFTRHLATHQDPLADDLWADAYSKLATELAWCACQLRIEDLTAQLARAQEQLKTIGRKAFWAAKDPNG